MNITRLISSLLALATTACLADFAPEEALPADRARDAGAFEGGTRSTRPSGAIDDDVSSGGGGGGPSAGDDVPAPPERDPDRAPCDLTGSWVVGERMVLNAIGARQVISVVRYLEIEQTGDALTVRKGLSCGDYVEGLPPILITMDSSKTWDVVRERSSMAGRKGTSRAASGGCSISLARHFEARGATLPTYLDFDVPLPSADQKASGGEPGWEDWDNDGNPGISVRISGSLSGTLYVTSRTWTEQAGTADPSGGSFVLPLRWTQERVPLGVSGSPLLAAPGGSPDADASMHLTQFAAVDASELGETDGEICARVRELAPKLVAKAMK